MARPVFVGNFEYDTRQSELERLFGKYGRVERVDIKSGTVFALWILFCFSCLFCLILFLMIRFSFLFVLYGILESRLGVYLVLRLSVIPF